MAAKRMAECAVTAALGVVLMLLGGVLELGMYACPLLVGLMFLPVGERYGRKCHTMLYVAVSLLCFLLVPNWEENLMLAGFFGWYPMLRPWLQKWPTILRWILKLALFNAAVIAIEWLLMAVIAPEAAGAAWLLLMLGLGNVLFVLYDRLIPRMGVVMKRLMKRK